MNPLWLVYALFLSTPADLPEGCEIPRVQTSTKADTANISEEKNWELRVAGLISPELPSAHAEFGIGRRKLGPFNAHFVTRFGSPIQVGVDQLVELEALLGALYEWRVNNLSFEFGGRAGVVVVSGVSFDDDGPQLRPAGELAFSFGYWFDNSFRLGLWLLGFPTNHEVISKKTNDRERLPLIRFGGGIEIPVF